MKTIFLILLLVSSAFACAETIPVQGRVTATFPIYRARVQTDIYFGYTNPFGYFSFTVPNCGTRTFTTTAKGYSFAPQTFILPIPDAEVLNIDFVAD